MQQDENELPPDDSPEPADAGVFEGAGTQGLPDELGTDDSQATAEPSSVDDAAGMSVIRAIEDSLANAERAPTDSSSEFQGSSDTSASGALAVNEAAAEAAPGEAVVSDAADRPMNAEEIARAALGPPPQVNWSPFMQLVLGSTPGPNVAGRGNIEQPWKPVNPPSTAVQIGRMPAGPPSVAGNRGPTISVSVQVHLTEDAIRRVAEATVAEEASKTLHQIEVVAKRLFDLEQNLFRQAAERRRLWG